MVGMWQDGVDAGPHFLRVISIDLRLVTNSDVKHPFVGIYTFSSVAIQTVSDQEKILLIFVKFFHPFIYQIVKMLLKKSSYNCAFATKILYIFQKKNSCGMFYIFGKFGGCTFF